MFLGGVPTVLMLHLVSIQLMKSMIGPKEVKEATNVRSSPRLISSVRLIKRTTDLPVTVAILFEYTAEEFIHC